MTFLQEELLNKIEELTKQIKQSATSSLLTERAVLLHLFGAKKEALLDIQAAIELAPEDSYLYYVRAAIFDDLGQENKAKESLKEALRLGFKPSGEARDKFIRLAGKYGLKVAGPKIPSCFIPGQLARKYSLPKR